MRYLYTLLCVVGGLATGYAQTQLLPQATQLPAWYVYEHALEVCLGEGCYPLVQVNKYTIEHVASTTDSMYVLKEEIISSNHYLSPQTPTMVGTFTIKPSGKVYFMPTSPYLNYSDIQDTSGILMYDPTASLGDTVNAGWVWQYNGTILDTSVNRPIELVDTINMAGTDRKHWVVGPVYEGWFYVEDLVNHLGLIPVDSMVHWVEGIGSNQGPYYNQFYEHSFKQLLCYEEMGDTIFRLVPSKPCDLGLFDISSVKDLALEESTLLYPNPSSQTITIGINSGNWEYEIINPLGATVHKGLADAQHNQVRFDLPNGTYLLVLRNTVNNTYISKRFVVAN